MKNILLTLILTTLMFMPVMSRAEPEIDQSEFFFSDPLNLSVGREAGGNLEDTTQRLVIRVVSNVIAFIGLLAFIMFVYSGVSWMLAAGNESKISSARKVMVWAVVGLLVTFFSYAALKILLNVITRSFKVQQIDSSDSLKQPEAPAETPSRGSQPTP